jgi:flagellin
MSLRIQSNIEAFDAHRNLVNVEDAITKSMQRLSSGYRINSASDDAAGLSISEKMQGQIRGLAQAQRNMGDGISLVQTADGALDAVHQMLQRVRELAVEYKNGTLSTQNRTAIQSEVNQLASEIDRVGLSTQFNGISLLDGTTTTVSFQVGTNDNQTITITLFSLGNTATGVGTNYFNLNAATNADISEIDAAIDNVSALRSQLGAVQNRLQYASDNAAVYQENLTAANSRIQDVDMASETVELTKNQILAQAGQAMLAQANQGGQGVLRLLQ